MPDNEADEAKGPDGPATHRAPSAAEAELLDVFARLAPVASHRWNFEESMSRLNPQPPPALANVVPPWEGLPPDVWARGRSAQVGQRMVGDVLAAVADLLATDARAAATEAAGAQAQAYRQQFTAAWDALRYLAARLERLSAGSMWWPICSPIWPGMCPKPRWGLGPTTSRTGSPHPKRRAR